MPHPSRILILGASTRAAAYSGLRAGFQPVCIDEYADRDLAAIAEVRRANGLEQIEAFEALTARHPGISWFYTGPLENRPELVETLARRRPLLGNHASVLRAVRDPFRVSAVLDRGGIPHPEVREFGRDLPRDGTWLLKPVASGGGRLVGLPNVDSSPPMESFYGQRFISGPSGSAVFVAFPDKVRLAGATRQLHGGPAGRFAYRGNVGPISLDEGLTSRLLRVGEVVARGFGLRGLFGVDFILADGAPWPVEVNPRYTASVEVLELGMGRSLLREHLAAFGVGEEGVPREAHGGQVVGKEVLYADHPLSTSEIARDPMSDESPLRVPEVADIPWPGTCIRRGEPILTVFAEGPDEAACLARLSERALRWRAVLQGGDGRLLLDGDAADLEAKHLLREAGDP